MNYLIVFIYFVFGAMFGSFLNVVILRLPEEQPLTGRSHCPHCGKTLGVMELFPLFSWLALRGKCRHCGSKISPRYFIIELLSALIFVFCWWYLKPVGVAGYLLLVKYLISLLALLAVFVIDFEHYLILDVIVYPVLVATGLLNLSLDFIAHQSLLGLHSYLGGGVVAALGGCLPFFLVWYFSNGKWMGFGDVKLALLLGMVLGWPQIFVGLMLGILSGGLFSIILLAVTAKTLKSRLPFGTFLTFGTVLAMFYGEKLLHWYLALLGF